ncbi:MAG: cupin domain-containing protein, partial [Bdellovibrionales bacterium]|nr:cupin domain-containing protein [Bdellovibrionales bacterium]
MSEIEIDLVKKFEDFMIIHQNQPGKKLPPHHHPEYQVIIPLQGEIALEVDHNKLTLGPGSMVFVPSEVSHSFYSSAKKGERLIFYLDPKLLNKKSKCFQQTRILSSNQLLIELLFHCLLHFESKIIPILKNTLIGLLEELLN